ncbi:MAG: S8 family serine peptidase [Patescibacteria group bacterium]
MKKVINFIVIFFILAGNFLFLPNFSFAKAVAKISDANSQPTTLLVKLKGSDEVLKFEFANLVNLEKVIAEYRRNDAVEYVEYNYKLKMTAFPNDPDFLLQWYLNQINIKDFWSADLLVRQQENIINQHSVIAILDTGFDTNNPDLKDKIWTNKKEIANDGLDNDKNGYINDLHGWNFVDGNNNITPSFEGNYDINAVKHGTIVSGIAAASVNNNEGIAGASWFSQIMPLRVLDSTGTGDVYSVVLAIDYAVANGVDVINMSFVGTGFSQSLYDSIKRAYDKGILVVAAAGNTDPTVNGTDLNTTKSYPVCYDGVSGENMVIGVASVGKDLRKSKFSNYGGCIDLVAPGEEFFSTQPYNKTINGFTNYYDGYWSGTSLSAPLVSGTLAAIKALRPNFSADEIRNFVLNNTKNIYSYNTEYQGKLGHGLLDASKALEAALAQKVSKSNKTVNYYLLAGLGLKSFPQIKILKTDGTVFKAFFAYDPKFNGPINVAACDVNGDNIDEVITAAGVGGGPHIRIFDINGHLLFQFFAYEKNFRGGANVACGDVNGDNIAEIVTAKGKGSLPEVKIFGASGNLVNKFLAYDKSFTGGVKVALGDVNRDGKDEVITGNGVGNGIGPLVKVFWPSGVEISKFFAFNKNSDIGVNVACGDIHGDGQPEIFVTSEQTSSPVVRIFTYLGSQVNSFFAYPPEFLTGLNVFAGDIDKDGISEIITGPVVGGKANIKVFNKDGGLKFEISAHNNDYRGGVRPAIIGINN